MPYLFLTMVILERSDFTLEEQINVRIFPDAKSKKKTHNFFSTPILQPFHWNAQWL